jgi:hypothetical protein
MRRSHMACACPAVISTSEVDLSRNPSNLLGPSPQGGIAPNTRPAVSSQSGGANYCPIKFSPAHGPHSGGLPSSIRRASIFATAFSPTA